ncbi:MAG: hypothetical protein CMI52_04960 [Parcubacteria group bacterium]|nr:hypothetical protein [Parcubacteria group bacterium]|tara:strand:+ start:1511 stop:2098 length:588 start_codon:yes stop_codon:yes gene_type:complete
MTQGVLVLVGGLSASGKSTLAKRISETMQVPLISRDEIKEGLFDKMGTGDRDWSKKVGAASYLMVYTVIEVLMKSGAWIIVESNFDPSVDSEKVQEIMVNTGCRVLQIVCWAEKRILMKRFQSRVSEGQRHPGHRDELAEDEIFARFEINKAPVLEVEGEVLQVDTTFPENIDYASVIHKIHKTLAGQGDVSRGT